MLIIEYCNGLQVRRRGGQEESDLDSSYENVQKSSLPPSCTRSGTQYGMKQWWARKHKRSLRFHISEDGDSPSQSFHTGSQQRLDFSMGTDQMEEERAIGHYVPLYGKGWAACSHTKHISVIDTSFHSDQYIQCFDCAVVA